MKWLFKKKETVDKYAQRRLQELITAKSEESQAQQALNISVEIGRKNLLDPSRKEVALREALYQYATKIQASQLDRNQKGAMAESSGDIPRAIELYEANVAGEFSGAAPYNRLRILYTKLNQKEEAIRVCRCAVNNPYMSDRHKEKFREWLIKHA